jgi:hypothetical protein
MVWIPAACGVVLLALVVRPRITGDPAARIADLALVLSVAAILLQLVPLPQSVLRVIDPNALGVRASLWLMVPPAGSDARLFPISIVPRDTVAALGILPSSASSPRSPRSCSARRATTCCTESGGRSIPARARTARS